MLFGFVANNLSTRKYSYSSFFIVVLREAGALMITIMYIYSNIYASVMIGGKNVARGHHL